MKTLNEVTLIKSEDEFGRYYTLKGSNLPTNYTLNNKNCDEIFGITDVKETIAKNINNYDIVNKAIDFSNAHKENDGVYLGYIAGAIEAFKSVELNKSTEIKIKIVTEKVVDKTKIIGSVKGVKGSGQKITTYKTVLKYDEYGNLILKRK